MINMLIGFAVGVFVSSPVAWIAAKRKEANKWLALNAAKDVLLAEAKAKAVISDAVTKTVRG